MSASLGDESVDQLGGEERFGIDRATDSIAPKGQLPDDAQGFPGEIGIGVANFGYGVLNDRLDSLPVIVGGRPWAKIGRWCCSPTRQAGRVRRTTSARPGGPRGTKRATAAGPPSSVLSVSVCPVGCTRTSDLLAPVPGNNPKYGVAITPDPSRTDKPPEVRG